MIVFECHIAQESIKSYKCLLRDLQKIEEKEIAHSSADALLCMLLRDLGLDEVVEEWHKIQKGYKTQEDTVRSDDVHKEAHANVEVYIQKLKKAQDLCYCDVETAHHDADDALCGLLNTLGYDNVVSEYNKIFRGYA